MAPSWLVSPLTTSPLGMWAHLQFSQPLGMGLPRTIMQQTVYLSSNIVIVFMGQRIVHIIFSCVM